MATNSYNHVFVVSHRRSGTHLTIDTIRNNFSYYNAPFVNLDLIDKDNPEHPEAHTLDQFKEKLSAAPHVIKTHSLPNWNESASSPEVESYIKELFSQSKKIYVFRNCFDVMVSLYEYNKTFNEEVKAQTFKEYLRTKRAGDDLHHFQYWNNHVGGWFTYGEDPSFRFIRYEELFLQYGAVLETLSAFFDLPLNEVKKDIRVAKPADDQGEYSYEDLQYTQGARKGIVGDFVNYFDAEDFALVESVVKEVHDRVGFNFAAPQS